MKLIGHLNTEDIDNFKLFLEIRTANSRSEIYEWNSEDPTILPGWKSRSTNNRNFFISPSGQQFMTRVAILQHIIQEGSGQEEVGERCMWPSWLRRCSQN